MSKKLTGLLGAVLVVMLAFSAAFAADGTSLTINLDAGKNDTNTPANSINVLTGNEMGSAAAFVPGTATVVDGTVEGVSTLKSIGIAESTGKLTAYSKEQSESPAESDAVTGTFSVENGVLMFEATGGSAAAFVPGTATVVDGTVEGVSTLKSIGIAESTGKLTAYSKEQSESPAESDAVAGIFSVEDSVLKFAATGDEVTFTVSAGQQLSGTYELTDETNKKYTFTAANDAKIKATIPGADSTTTEVDLAFNGATFELTSTDKDDNDAALGYVKWTLSGAFTGSTTVESTTTSYSFESSSTLTGSEDVVAVASKAFVSSDIKVYMNGTLHKTVTASADINSADVYVDLGAKVSFDVVLSSDVLGVSEDGVALASKDKYYTLSKDFAASGDKAVVVITFASGDAGGTFKFTLNVIASGDSSKTATTETYLLKVSDITLTPANAVSNTAKLISADTDNYSATLSLTNLDSTASGDWGSFADFTVSSDYLGGSFSVTVSTDATLVNVYVKNGTAWGEVDTEEVSGKVITPNTIGTYKVVLSADLVASSDKTVSGDAYFAFDFTVASVDAAKATGDVVVNADNASADATGGVGGNPIIAGGQKIDTKFLSGTSISPSAFASFFSSATTVTMLSETELAAALETLGLDETYMGNAEEGYKALAFGLPSGFTLTSGEKFFVLLTTNENGTGTNRLGIGVVPPALNGSSTMVIVFRLLKNPARTADFMTFDAGEYFVGATNDTASADTSSSTRALFVTAGGTFNIKSDEATLLQGQTASGTATPYEGDDDDDDNQETSSHGSSSGCDAGFGALALLAVAGALAARKVRK